MDLFIVYGLMLISLIITLGAQVYVNSSYNKYRKIRNKRGITGSDAARTFLDRHGMSDVKIGCVKGTLSDHYDPRSKTVNLSREIYSGTSIAAVSVACHECGHALQDKTNYSFMRLRASLVPVTRVASYAGYIAIAVGAALGAIGAIWFGILCEVAILLFQIVTLPVEFDASKRALNEMDSLGFFDSQEIKYGRTMLTAAALTYVASVAATLIQIFRLALMFTRRND